MISKLRVKNFESHVDSILDLAPGLNVLVGLTDAGKSSLFRALHWLMFNRPNGDWMRPLFNNKAEATEVSVVLDDGVEVVRTKKGNQNEYVIRYGKDSYKRLTGFGKGDVPKDVYDALRMDEINFQSQIELPFLMFQTPGERSRTLNKVAGLDDIDRTLAAADSDTRRVRASLENERENLKRLQEAQNRFKDLDDRKACLMAAEQAEKGIAEKGLLVEQIEYLIERLNEIDPGIEECKETVLHESALAIASATMTRIEKNEQKLDHLNELVSDLSDIDEFVGTIEWVQSKNISSDFERVRSIIKGIEEKDHQALVLNHYCLNLEELESKIEKEEGKLEDMIKQLPSFCPSCKRPLL